jgi:hypothetical protein
MLCLYNNWKSKKNATYKASILNEFGKNNNIKTVIEFGCGERNQAMQFDFPSYIYWP